MLCKNCHKKPCYGNYDFCGKTCGGEYSRHKSDKGRNKWNSYNHNPAPYTGDHDKNNFNGSSYNGSTNYKYSNSNSNFSQPSTTLSSSSHSYASSSHGNSYQDGGIYPKDQLAVVLYTSTTDFWKIQREFKDYGVKIEEFSWDAAKTWDNLETYLGQCATKCMAVCVPKDLEKEYKLVKKNSKVETYKRPVDVFFDGKDELVSTLKNEVIPKSVKKVNFYSKNKPFYQFTNFWECNIKVPVFENEKKELEWKTSEHYFQAMKFTNNMTMLKQVQKLNTPREVFDFPRSNLRYIRSDWDQVKEDVMEKALYAKFTQNMDLKELLLMTGEAMLVEHTTNDAYWGDNGDGTGLNRLGYLLVKIRNRIRQEMKQAGNKEKEQDTHVEQFSFSTSSDKDEKYSIDRNNSTKDKRSENERTQTERILLDCTPSDESEQNKNEKSKDESNETQKL